MIISYNMLFSNTEIFSSKNKKILFLHFTSQLFRAINQKNFILIFYIIAFLYFAHLQTEALPFLDI